jgi:hypothetical protein
VLFHIPPPLRYNSSHIEYGEWEKVKKVLDKFKERIVCVFCGHIIELSALNEGKMKSRVIAVSGREEFRELIR